jgi:opacity protein-like surface antigen
MEKQFAMFVGRIVAVAALVAVGVVRAQAQAPPRVEIAFETGYTASEGIQTSSARIIGGQVYNDLDIKSGANFGFLAGVYVTPNAEVEFLWNRQLSQFDASNPAPSQLLADVSVDNYHGNFVYNWFESDAKVRPFLFGGIGATHYSPGDPVSLPKVTSATGIDSATKFSFTWGGGVKLYPTPHFGVRLSARWTPTYIKSDAGGIWCDPYYGPCWVLADPDYSNQFAINGGVTFKFD